MIWGIIHKVLIPVIIILGFFVGMIAPKSQAGCIMIERFSNNFKKGFTMLKEILYTSIGGAALFKERVEEEIKRLQERGKMSKEDAGEFLDKLKVRGEEEENRVKAELKEALKEVISELNLATKEDIERLKSDKM